MRKAQIVSGLFVLVFILIAGVMGANQVNAVVCPAGYVCTPTSQTTVACPAGYICEPIKPAPAVITGLTYKKEDGSEIKWCYSITKNLGELDGADGYLSTGADVVALQSQLISLGYDIPSVSSGGSARGQFDDDTRYAVMKYQASKGIPSTGYVGPLTRASLNGLCNVKNSVGSNEYGFWTKAYYSNGKLNIGWTNSSLNFDYYQVVLGNSFLNKEIQLGANFAKNQTSYIANIPTEFADFVKLNSKGQDAFYVKVNTIKSDSVSGYIVSTAKSELFTISPGTSPSPTPSIGATSIKVLSPREGDRWNVGSTYTISWQSTSFPDGAYVYLNGGGREEGYSKYIGKTSNSSLNYVVTSADLPLNLGNTWRIAVCNGALQNGGNDCAWSGQIFVSSSSDSPVITRINPTEYSKSGQEITLYGNNLDGTTNIEFFHTDGKSAGGVFPSSVSANKVTFNMHGLFVENSGYSTYFVSVVTNKCKGGCDSNRVVLKYQSSNSPTPSPTQTPAQPSVSFTYPRYSETWYLGETKNVSWTYNNFDSSMSGEKYVELQLIPQDGRAPVVLGTYTAPYGYQPLTIYTKTSTGRDAWLPGEYKLRLVCRATNIDGFRNCRTDVPGYITVKAPMPTPTSTPVSVNPNNDLNAAIWSAVEEYNRGR